MRRTGQWAAARKRIPDTQMGRMIEAGQAPTPEQMLVFLRSHRMEDDDILDLIKRVSAETGVCTPGLTRMARLILDEQEQSAEAGA